MNDDEIDVTNFRVRTIQNRHPGGAKSFRIEYGSEIIIYSTDHEAGDSAVDASLTNFAKGANLWILDAQFNSEERQHHMGWGHSSHLEAVNLALEAKVETAVLFHHNPDHDDITLDRMASEAMEAVDGTKTKVIMARDGLVVDIN